MATRHWEVTFKGLVIRGWYDHKSDDNAIRVRAWRRPDSGIWHEPHTCPVDLTDVAFLGLVEDSIEGRA